MTNKLTGFCIRCGRIIPLDINQPFCEECFSLLQDFSRPSKKEGEYCHYCRRISQSININTPRCKECKPFARDDNSIDDYYLEKIMEYKSMSFTERQKIKPQWSCNEDENAYQLKNKCVRKVVKITDVLKIVESRGNLIITDVFNNEPKYNRRIMSILRAWNKGIQIDPPTISYGDSVNISDGRHRTLAAHFLGAETLPVYFIKNRIDNQTSIKK